MSSIPSVNTAPLARTPSSSISVVLLHEGMIDKQRTAVTTSLTLLDVHDLARSARTYEVSRLYVAHPAAIMRKLARTLHKHWDEGFGASYNPRRKEALSLLEIVATLDEAIADVDRRIGKLPKLVATCARQGGKRFSYKEFRQLLNTEDQHYLLMFGTGWGMGEELIERADLFLEAINGPGPYNHLSVRSACAIILDRVLAPQV